MYSLDVIIRYVNFYLAIGAIPALCILSYNFIRNGSHDRLISTILATAFILFTIALLFTIAVNTQLLFMNTPIEDVVLLANIRNLIKNLAIFLMGWGFVFVEYKRR